MCCVSVDYTRYLHTKVVYDRKGNFGFRLNRKNTKMKIIICILAEIKLKKPMMHVYLHAFGWNFFFTMLKILYQILISMYKFQKLPISVYYGKGNKCCLKNKNFGWRFYFDRTKTISVVYTLPKYVQEQWRTHTIPTNVINMLDTISPLFRSLRCCYMLDVTIYFWL